MSSPPPAYHFPQGPQEWTDGELATVIILAIFYVFDLVLAVFLIANRNYRPVRALQLPLIVAMILATGCLQLGMITAVRLVPPTGAFYSCAFWGGWMYHTAMAACLTIICFRFARLYRIIIMRKSASGWFQALPFILIAPNVIVSIVLTVADGNRHVIEPITGSDICYMLPPYFFSYVAYHIFLGLLFIYLALCLRRSRFKIYNEYYRTLLFFAVFAMCIVLSVSLVVSKSHYMPWGRIVICFAIGFATNMYLYIITGRVAFRCLFKPQEFLAEFDRHVHAKAIVLNSDDLSSSLTSSGTKQQLSEFKPETEVGSA